MGNKGGDADIKKSIDKARASNFTIGMGQDTNMKTSNKIAF
jgi:hypothetical protein